MGLALNCKHFSLFKNVRFTREYLGQLLLEDSCHYLLYSLMFLYNVYPLTGILFKPLSMLNPVKKYLKNCEYTARSPYQSVNWGDEYSYLLLGMI